VTNEKEIVELAEKKIIAADILLKNGFADDAYYIGGYSFELLLKARICKVLGVSDFFETRNEFLRPESWKMFKVHDYKTLLVFAGLYNQLKTLEETDPVFKSDWRAIVPWDENARYLNSKTDTDVMEFLESLKNMIVWLKQFL
jgi:hypothetical protein